MTRRPSVAASEARARPWADALATLARGAAFVLATSAAAATGAFLVARITPPTYLASVGVVAAGPTSEAAAPQVFVPPTVDPAVYRNVVVAGPVLPAALARLDGVAPDDAALALALERVAVRVEEGDRSSTLWIDVRDGDPERAAALANALAEGLVAWDRQRGLRAIERSVEAVQTSIAELTEERRLAAAAGDQARVGLVDAVLQQRDQELATAREASAGALVVGLLETLRPASPPDRPVAPRVGLTTGLAAVLGLLLGMALQAGLRAMDPRIGSRRELARRVGLPVLAEFPVLPRHVARPDVEAASFLRTAVATGADAGAPQVLLVTSPTETAEKAQVAAALAESFARSGARTLLVDADLRQPGVSHTFDLVPHSTASFHQVLASGQPQRPPVEVQVDGRHAFHLMPSWDTPRFPTDALYEGLGLQLAAWRDAYDVVILDAPPVLPFADALIMAPSCTAALVCVSRLRSRRDPLAEATALLRRAGRPVAGLVLTDTGPPRGPRRAPADELIVGREAEDAYRVRILNDRDEAGKNTRTRR